MPKVMTYKTELNLSALPPSPPILHFTVDHYGGIPPKEAALLRDKALTLASANHLDAALPLFEAVAAVRPNDAQQFSDLGVTWMRMGAWAQAWGSFAKALAIDPVHPLALENAADLRKFLGEKHPVVVNNSLSPPPRTPRPIEHDVKLGALMLSLPPADIKMAWHRTPFVLRWPAPAAKDDPLPVWSWAKSASSSIEHVLATTVPHLDARFYAGGRPHVQSIAYTRPVVSTLRVLRAAAGRAGRAIARIPLDGRRSETVA